jgi:hypothetical protein
MGIVTMKSVHKSLFLVALALLLLGAHPTRCTQPGTVYGLTADSTAVVEGCFPPLTCPSAISDIRGTFRLVPLRVGVLFEEFGVMDAYWLVRVNGEDLRVTGFGKYQIGGEFVTEHRLQLALQVGDGEVQFFDSGFVDTVPVVFPDIDITISVNGEAFVDTVIAVRAVPFPTPDAA